MKKLTRSLRALAIATVAATALSGCVFVPALLQGPPVQDPDQSPTQTGFTPPPTPTTTPSAEPTETPTADPTTPPEQESVSLGELRDGNPLTSDSGEAADEPIDVTIPPSTGTAAPGPNQYGDVNDGQAFTPSDGELVASTVGRLYIEFPGGRTMVCSGTVVNSEYGNMVVTAAHCLYSAIDGEMSSRVQFVPADADNGNTAPYGLWEGDEWIVPQVFVDTAKEADNRSTGRGWAYDFGWVRLLPDGSGANVQDYTGGQGISFNQQYQGGLLVGYPSGPPFDGNSQRYCSQQHLGFGTMYWPHLTISCSMTPGISGGGWLTGVDPSTGAGYVGAVYSTVLPDSGSGAMLGSLAYDLMKEIEQP
ncbi:trypsin-like serine peptidase [Agrococcus casei]|uniref:trypsin-like serine peptidase n=1 Tax=Agrococcus casei TaxID=343512 RepID=UPI003F8EFA4D